MRFEQILKHPLALSDICSDKVRRVSEFNELEIFSNFLEK